MSVQYSANYDTNIFKFIAKLSNCLLERVKKAKA